MPNTNPLAQGLASIGITGFFTLGDAQQPFVKRVNEVLQVTDDFTLTRGAHALKIGVDVRKEHMVIAFINRPNGDMTFNGVQTGNAAADFLLGLPSQFRRTTTNQAQDGTGWLYSGYAQDEWRPGGGLTLSAGLRYELAQPFVDSDDALNAFHPGVQSVRFPAAPVGLVYPGDPGVPRGTYKTDTNNLAPRLGVVWDVSGRATTTVRAAWGVFYDALAGQGDFFQNGVLAPPFTPLVEVNSPPAAITLSDPLSSATGGATPFPPNLTIIGWGPDFQTPYAHHFNATVQRQVGGSIAIEAGYVGSRGAHLPMFIEVNPGLYSPGQTIVGARLLPAFSLVRPTFPVAKSRYDALQASARLRSTRGVSVLASSPRSCPGSLVRVEHRRRAPPGAAGDNRRRSLFRSGAGARVGRCVVRRAAPPCRELHRGAPVAASAESPAPVWRVAADRNRADANRLSGHADESAARHPLPDQPA